MQFSHPRAGFQVSTLSSGLCVRVCLGVVHISVFSSTHRKKLLVCAAVHAVLYLFCVAVFAHTCIRLCVCVCVCVCINLLLPPPRLIAFLKSSWFAQSPRLEPHTQQMFHWKGHECLIICVIDAAFLFVSKCERLLGSYVSIFACYASVCVRLCVRQREILIYS